MDSTKIRNLAKAKGLTLEALAEKIGLSQSYFSRLLNGKRGLKLLHLEKIAHELNKPVSALVDSHDNSATAPRVQSGLTTIGVVGYVQAGNWREADPLDEMLEELHIPHDSRWTSQPVAFRVLGDSYDEHVKEGGFVIGVRFQDTPVELKKGMTVVAQRSRFDGQMVEWTLKMVYPMRNGTYELRPCSSNKSHKIIRFPSAEKETSTMVYAVVTTFVQPAAWPK